VAAPGLAGGDPGRAVRRIAWRQVSRAVLEERWTIATRDVRSRRHGTCLLLIDHQGVELLRLDVPLRPQAAYADFLRCLPVWTGKAVESVRC